MPLGGFQGRLLSWPEFCYLSDYSVFIGGLIFASEKIEVLWIGIWGGLLNYRLPTQPAGPTPNVVYRHRKAA